MFNKIIISIVSAMVLGGVAVVAAAVHTAKKGGLESPNEEDVLIHMKSDEGEASEADKAIQQKQEKLEEIYKKIDDLLDEAKSLDASGTLTGKTSSFSTFSAVGEDYMPDPASREAKEYFDANYGFHKSEVNSFGTSPPPPLHNDAFSKKVPFDFERPPATI